jgi:hypothetical protein
MGEWRIKLIETKDLQDSTADWFSLCTPTPLTPPHHPPPFRGAIAKYVLKPRQCFLWISNENLNWPSGYVYIAMSVWTELVRYWLILSESVHCRVSERYSCDKTFVCSGHYVKHKAPLDTLSMYTPYIHTYLYIIQSIPLMTLCTVRLCTWAFRFMVLRSFDFMF